MNITKKLIKNLNESEYKKLLKENSDEYKVYMNTWKNYNSYNGGDASNIHGGWMTIDDAINFTEDMEAKGEEPFINDTDGELPFEVDEYSNALDTLNNIKKYFEVDETDRPAFAAILEDRYTSDGFENCLEILESGDYVFFPDVNNDYDLGKAYVDMAGFDYNENYIDRDAVIEAFEIDDDEVDDEDFDANTYYGDMADEEIQNAVIDKDEDYMEKYYDYEALGRDLSLEGFGYMSTGALQTY